MPLNTVSTTNVYLKINNLIFKSFFLAALKSLKTFNSTCHSGCISVNKDHISLLLFAASLYYFSGCVAFLCGLIYVEDKNNISTFQNNLSARHLSELIQLLSKFYFIVHNVIIIIIIQHHSLVLCLLK